MTAPGLSENPLAAGKGGSQSRWEVDGGLSQGSRLISQARET